MENYPTKFKKRLVLTLSLFQCLVKNKNSEDPYIRITITDGNKNNVMNNVIISGLNKLKSQITYTKLDSN